MDANKARSTINSMFLGLDGVLYDYLLGHEDIKSQNCEVCRGPGAEDPGGLSRIRFRYGRIRINPTATRRTQWRPHSGTTRGHGEDLRGAYLDGMEEDSQWKIHPGAHSQDDPSWSWPLIGLPEPGHGTVQQSSDSEEQQDLDLEPMTKMAALLRTRRK